MIQGGLMISQQQAIEAGWHLFTASVAASEVHEVEAKLIDETWSVMFFKHPNPHYVDAPGFWLILVSANGQAESFDVL